MSQAILLWLHIVLSALHESNCESYYLAYNAIIALSDSNVDFSGDTPETPSYVGNGTRQSLSLALRKNVSSFGVT